VDWCGEYTAGVVWVAEVEGQRAVLLCLRRCPARPAHIGLVIRGVTPPAAPRRASPCTRWAWGTSRAERLANGLFGLANGLLKADAAVPPGPPTNVSHTGGTPVTPAGLRPCTPIDPRNKLSLIVAAGLLGRGLQTGFV